MSIASGQSIARAALKAVTAGAVLAFLSGCGAGFLDDGVKFSSAEYGVAASERLIRSGPVPRGGGRYQVGRSYRVAGRTYTPREDPSYDETGIASWYGPNFHGRQTANGEIFDANFLSAAHPTLPLPSYVRVFNMENGRSAIVRVNDRGPFAHDRLIDLSQRTAEVLGFINSGTARVRVQYVGPAPLEGDDSRYLMASINTPNATVPLGDPSMGNTRDGGSTVLAHQRPSPISREAGGLVGSFVSLFSYADAQEQGGEIISSAFDATNEMAARADALEEWRLSMDADARHVDIDLGIYRDVITANEVARHFATIGAIDYVDEGVPAGAVGLRLTYLKPGVTLQDVNNVLADMQLVAMDPQ